MDDSSPDSTPETKDTSDVGDTDVMDTGTVTGDPDTGDADTGTVTGDPDTGDADTGTVIGDPDTGDNTGSDEVDTDDDNTDTEKLPTDLVDCDASEEFLDADCGTYTTFHGTLVQLGPYGAHLDTNVGQGFETDVALGDQMSAVCSVFVGTFNVSQEETERILDTEDLDFALHSVYRPAVFKEGETYPLITWGNGTCAMPEGYGTLLRYVASYGFIVVAANSRWVGGNNAMRIALDFMFAANEDPNSPYYQKIDTEKVGAMGHSQGGGATGEAATADSRIKAAILFNGGETDAKPFLTISGDRDVGDPTVDAYENTVNNASQPAAFLFYHKIPEGGSMTGHLTLMQEPERVIEPTMHWFNYMLNNDKESSKWFLGDDCELCNKDEDFEYGQNGLLPIP